MQGRLATHQADLVNPGAVQEIQSRRKIADIQEVLVSYRIGQMVARETVNTLLVAYRADR
jgi:hypothetical protein